MLHQHVGDLMPSAAKRPGDRLVLLFGDAWLAIDDEVSLTYRPLVPTLEGDLKAVAERARHRFGLSARKHRTVDRDWLPPTQPRAERGHDREFGQLVILGPLIDGPRRTVGPQLGEFERAQVLSGAERDRPRRRLIALAGDRFIGLSAPLPKRRTTPRQAPVHPDF